MISVAKKLQLIYSHLFFVLTQLRALGAPQAENSIGMRLKIAMWWVPAEQTIKAEKMFS